MEGPTAKTGVRIAEGSGALPIKDRESPHRTKDTGRWGKGRATDMILPYLAAGLREFPQAKVFCIGLNKTGTTSIGDALACLGYSRFGWRPQQSPKLTRMCLKGNIEQLLQIAHKFDAFEDYPWFLCYREMAAIFPNAKFILTIRKDEETWLRSVCDHTKVTGHAELRVPFYGSADPARDPDLYLKKYAFHIEEARRFFGNQPGRLLEMCFETGSGWGELCRFLGMTTLPSVPFPHRGKTADKGSGKVVRRNIEAGRLKEASALRRDS